MDGEDALDTSQLERRHITVLECDLVGSTKLASNLDPEEFRDLILAYQDCVTALVEEYNGYFVQFAGDAVWSYFGYPFAHEDDACQAIRAGLAITKAANSLKIYNKLLNVRIGIASGLCVVGNMRQASEESKKENQITAFGNPPNLASRLQTLVIPGSVAVSDDTRYLAGDLFDFEDLGFHKIKGFSKETKVWRVIGESVERNRFRALRPKSQSPIVGRENELVTLSDLWKRSCSGKGKVVYISGEPGIGKSRLVSSLAETIVGSRYLQWWLHCAEYSQGSAFAPVITHIQAQSGIRDSDDIHARFKKLAGKYSEFNSDELYFLAELLLVESVSNLKTPIISASKRRESIYEVLIKLLIQEAEERPLLIVAEDAHWIDPSTHELLQRLSLRVEFLPVLLVITSRVTEDNGNHYLKLSYSHKIKVEQLQQNDSFKLIDSLWNLNELPEQLGKQIVNQTDGVPLFIEDVTFSLLRSVQSSPDDLKNSKVTVPGKLSEHLMSRIDKLGESRNIAQIGSVIGREFSLSMLKTLTNLTASKLEKRINKLIDSGLLMRNEQTADPSYIFKHAMIRDAAYESLLISDRMELHSRIATCLETEKLCSGKTQPETIAHHYEIAEAFELAVDYWLQAGLNSNDRSNYLEASIHLQNACKLIPELGASPKRDRIELDIIIALGVALAGAGGISGEDTGKAYEKALTLCKELDYPAETFPVLAGLSSFYFLRSHFREVRENAALAIKLAEEKRNPNGDVYGNRIYGAVQLVTGEFDKSINSLKKAINIYEENSLFQTENTLAYILDHKTSALCYLGLAHLTAGRIDTALKVSEQSLVHAKTIDMHSVNCSLCYQSAIRFLRCDPAGLIINLATRSLEIGLKEGYATWIGISRLLKGEAIIRLGFKNKGMNEIEQGVSEHSNVLARTFLPFALSVLAKGYLMTNQHTKSLEVLIEAEALSIKTEQYWYLAEVQRLYAETLAELEQYEAAYNYYKKAWGSAEKIGAKFWQLKIAYSVASNENISEMYKESNLLLADSISFINEGIDIPFVAKTLNLAKKMNV